MRRPRRLGIWLLAGLILAVVAAFYVLIASRPGLADRLLNRPVRVLRPNARSHYIKSHPTLLHAVMEYESRGASYVWGKNDCSTLVCDYLKLALHPKFPRLPTRVLIQSRTMSNWGLYPTSRVKEGDILVYRYLNRTSQEQGHTGIVFLLQGQRWVLHNAAGFKGLVAQPIEDFMAKAGRATKISAYRVQKLSK